MEAGSLVPWDDLAAAGEPLVSVTDLITLGVLGDPSAGLRAALDAHLRGLVASLELRLNRPITVRQFTDLCVPDDSGLIFLSQSPVVEIIEVTVGGIVQTSYGGTGIDPRAVIWRAGTPVTVRYTAGLDTARYSVAIRAAVLHKALPYARALLAVTEAPDPETPVESGGGLAIPAPVPGVKQFVVEGLQVTYESDSEITTRVIAAAQKAGAAAQWTAEEISATGIPRRPVVAT